MGPKPVKRVLLGTLAAAALIGAASPCAAEHFVTTRTDKGWSVVDLDAPRTYRDPDGRFEVQVPAGWAATKDADSHRVELRLGDTTVSLGAEDFPDTTEKDWLELDAGLISKSCSVRFSPVEARVVANSPGKAFVATCDGPKLPTWGRMSVSKIKSRLYFADVVTPTRDMARLRSVYEWIVDSFAPLPRPEPDVSLPLAELERRLAVLEDACRAGVMSAPACAGSAATLLGQIGKARAAAPRDATAAGVSDRR